MRHIGIDFSRNKVPVLGASLRSALWWGLGVVALVATLSAAGVLLKANADAQGLAAHIDQLDAATQTEDAQPQSVSSLSPDALEVVNGAVNQLNYPWFDVLGALERHVRSEVFLMSLEVGIVRSSTKIIIQAPDIDEALSYVDSLKDEPALRGISVVKQETTSSEGSGSAIRLTLDLPQRGGAVMPVAPRGGR